MTITCVFEYIVGLEKKEICFTDISSTISVVDGL